MLTSKLKGAEILYNTYWIRFPYNSQAYESALNNTRILFRCAKQVGVKRIVHIGVTRASLDSYLPYCKGKAMQELILKESGVPFVRPTLVFGKEDILVNNIAWLIRKSPVFLIFESENYRIQPVYVGDLAEIAICQSTIDSGTTMDATRPETFTFREFVEFIVQKVGSKTVFIKTPSSVGIFCGKILGLFLRDVLLTYDELKGLMDKMLTSTQVPKMTRISDWLAENKAMVGSTYSSEIVRRFRWSPT